mmetsp:Transcript_12803/g.36083  ORF Transcript_12803/g.36083 Transcript_12803/m.36083 type:complete len:304 (+) Transcript_12803:682-1593(+)
MPRTTAARFSGTYPVTTASNKREIGTQARASQLRSVHRAPREKARSASEAACSLPHHHAILLKANLLLDDRLQHASTVPFRQCRIRNPPKFEVVLLAHPPKLQILTSTIIEHQRGTTEQRGMPIGGEHRSPRQEGLPAPGSPRRDSGRRQPRSAELRSVGDIIVRLALRQEPLQQLEELCQLLGPARQPDSDVPRWFCHATCLLLLGVCLNRLALHRHIVLRGWLHHFCWSWLGLLSDGPTRCASLRLGPCAEIHCKLSRHLFLLGRNACGGHWTLGRQRFLLQHGLERDCGPASTATRLQRC